VVSAAMARLNSRTRQFRVITYDVRLIAADNRIQTTAAMVAQRLIVVILA